MTKSAARIVFSHIIGFIIFLVLLGIANILIPYISYPGYSSFIYFINPFIAYMLIMTIIEIVNDLLWNYNFPFNIFAPITSAVLSAFIVYFIYSIFIFIENYYEFTINIPINILLIIIPMIVLLSGYAIIIARGGKSYDNHMILQKTRKKIKESEIISKKDKEDFKEALYMIGDKLNRGLDEIKEKLSDKEKDKIKNKRKKKKR